MDIKETLYSMQDETYRIFHASLVPGIKKNIGVRTKELRKMAKSLAKMYGMDCISTISDDTYEEVLLQGLVIAYSKVDLDKRLQAIASYLSKIQDWATCDLFVSSLKFVHKNQEIVWEWMMPYLYSEDEYVVRFVIVMMLSYYLNDEYVDRCLSVLDKVHHDGYYVKMAIAWTISIAYIRYPQRVQSYLLFCQLDRWTYNKAIQKIIESKRIDKEEKEELKKLKWKL